MLSLELHILYRWLPINLSILQCTDLYITAVCRGGYGTNNKTRSHKIPTKKPLRVKIHYTHFCRNLQYYFVAMVCVWCVVLEPIKTFLKKKPNKNARKYSWWRKVIEIGRVEKWWKSNQLVATVMWGFLIQLIPPKSLEQNCMRLAACAMDTILSIHFFISIQKYL